MRASYDRGLKTKLAVAVTLLGSFAVACNALLDFDAYRVEPADGGSPEGASADDGGTADDGGCIDPAGFGGRGCFRCTPTTNDELLGACTSSQFEAFDNAARIVGFDASDPRPALGDGGTTPAPFPPPATVDGGVAQGECDLNVPNPVMVLGATGFPMETVAKALGPTGGAPAAATIFYREESSCVGAANALLNNRKLGGADPARNVVVKYDSVSGAGTKCILSDEHPADINLSALFLESCAGSVDGLGDNPSLPADVVDFLGPVNPVMLATPSTSTEKVISAEAAYRVYGFKESGVAPWLDENYIFRRTDTSANQQTVARSLGLPIGELRGRDSRGSSNMKVALQSSDAPDKTIGISASEIVDINRDVLKTLAYQHYNQPVGFYPDSAPGASDRRNVRDGHYYLWIPLHVLARVSAGDPVAASGNAILDAITPKVQRDAAVKQLVLVMVSRLEPVVKSVNYLAALKQVGNVPQCAMQVTRAKEGAPLQSFAPTTRCGCAFEATFPGTAPPECQSCTDSSTCPTERPTCSFGYCE